MAYLSLVDDNKKIHYAFVIGKARLAPTREVTTPILELSTVLISVKLSKIVLRELEFKLDKVLYGTDSTSVLKCLNNETKRFHTFESNRITTICNESSVAQLRYVPSDENPADDSSKGLKLNSMLRNTRWLNGPDFPRKEEKFRPQMIAVPP